MSNIVVERNAALNLTLTVNDVIGLATTQLEASIHQQRKEARKRLRQLDEQLTQIGDQIEQQKQQDADSVIQGLTDWSSLLATLNSVCDQKVELEASGTVSPKQPEQFEVFGYLRAPGQYAALTIPLKPITVAVSEALQALLRQQQELLEERKAAVQYMKDLDESLGDVPQYAAQAHAALTRMVLSNEAPTGDDLLRMAAQIESQGLQALPAPPTA